MTALLVALAGAVGSLARWALSGAVQRLAPGGFPVGTLVVNVLGSVAIGAVMAVFTARGSVDSTARIAITAGFLGGFTTMSAFAYETIALLEKRALAQALANVGITLAICLAACAAGLALGRFATR